MLVGVAVCVGVDVLVGVGVGVGHITTQLKQSVWAVNGPV